MKVSHKDFSQKCHLTMSYQHIFSIFLSPMETLGQILSLAVVVFYSHVSEMTPEKTS